MRLSRSLLRWKSTWVLVSAVAIVAILAMGGEAKAQSLAACSSSCPARYYWEDSPLTRAAPAAAPVAGQVGSGMNLTGVGAAWVSVCAESGQTLSGAGDLHAYYYDVGAALWMRNPDLDLEITVTGTSCGGSPCRCQTWPQWQVGAVTAGWVLYAPSGVTASGGTSCSGSPCVRVRIGGVIAAVR